jgi:hypothetical protein
MHRKEREIMTLCSYQSKILCFRFDILSLTFLLAYIRSTGKLCSPPPSFSLIPLSLYLKGFQQVSLCFFKITVNVSVDYVRSIVISETLCTKCPISICHLMFFIPLRKKRSGTFCYFQMS